jgi:hypothetical protein
MIRHIRKSIRNGLFALCGYLEGRAAGAVKEAEVDLKEAEDDLQSAKDRKDLVEMLTYSVRARLLKDTSPEADDTIESQPRVH